MKLSSVLMKSAQAVTVYIFGSRVLQNRKH
jgi:hypothetical protein